MSEIRNGVDVDKLEEIINALKSDPVKAQVKFQAETKWINCAYSKTKIRNFTKQWREMNLYPTLEATEFPIQWKLF